MKFKVPEASQSSRMDDATYLANCAALEDSFLDWEDEESNVDNAVVADNIGQALETLAACADPKDLLVAFNNDAELVELCGENPEKFEDNLKSAYEAANEAMLQDFNRTGLIGMLIARSHKTVQYLEPVLTESIQKLSVDKENADNRLQGSGDLSSKLNPVRSPYLPSFKEFEPMYKGIINCYNLLKAASADLNKIGEGAVITALEGTPFAKNGKVTKAASKNHFVYTWLIGSATSPLFDKNKPVGQRGWDADKLINAAKKALDLVKKMKEMEVFVAKVKVTDGVDKSKVKLFVKTAKFFTTEAGYIGRGVAAAARQATSGYVSRVGQKLGGEY